MRQRRIEKGWAALVLFAIVAGCASAPTTHQQASVITAPPEAVSLEYSVLLGFESINDLSYVFVDHDSVALDASHVHSGAQSISIPASAHNLEVNLSGLLGGTPPNDWTLAGAYFYVEKPTMLLAICEVDATPVAHHLVGLAPGAWTGAWVELPPDISGIARKQHAVLTFEFPQGISGQVYCDDVTVRDNRQTLVNDVGSSWPDVWTVRRDGYSIVLERPGGLKKVIRTSEATADGWTLEEANELRARFSSRGGAGTLAIYADGRVFEDGKYNGDWVVSDPWHDEYPLNHKAPAQLQVPEAEGRLDRNSPGDVRNMGYSPLWGCYELVAFGKRMEIGIAPASPALSRPVFEIAGLPAGKAVVMLEGELISDVCRLPNGNLLIELPARVLRPATLEVRIE
jgi:hypothetical protein